MRRRSGSAQDGIGSDSFLDIIANIVGILIILIVMAGLRVAQQPIVLSTGVPENAEREDVIELPAVSLAPVVDSAYELTLRTPQPPAPTVVEDPKPIVIEPSGELIARVQELGSRVQQSRSEIARVDQAQAAANGKAQQIDRQLQNAETQLNAVSRELRMAIDGERQLQTTLVERQDKYAALRQQLVDVEMHDDGEVEAIRHRLTPLGRTVDEHEVHFCVAANRVAYVPVEELLLRLKSQIERQKDWLSKFPRHEGIVGPVDGYSMRYVVQRQTLSFADRMRYGSGLMRIGVSEWVLEPEHDIVTETIEEALQPGSQFYRRLQIIDRPAVVTLWVYPESFGGYRKLRKLVHAQGLQVAGRPLPQGVPIAGGPRGSRSTAQ